MPRSYSPEFRRKVLDLAEPGRPIKQIAEMFGISNQTIYLWRRQHLIDAGRLAGVSSSENAEPPNGGTECWRRDQRFRIAPGLC